MNRRWTPCLAILLVLSVAGLTGGIQAAEKYPVKPITFIVCVEAGSDADLMARPITQKASQILGQPVIVVNKPGGGGSIGYREIYGAKPDGYTIGYAAPSLLINKMQGLLPYDVRDYTIMGSYAIQVPIVVGSTKTQRPFKTIQEAISFAKLHPGEVSIATAGVGYTMWVAAMAFQEATSIKCNTIPQAGAGALIIAQVAGGHTDLGVLFLLAAKSQIEAGNACLLAVIGSKRIPGYDQVPTLKEIGYNISIESPNFVIGPPKIPKEIADKLSKAFQGAAGDPEFQKFALERNAIPLHEPPDKLIKSIEEERRIYRTIMEKAGILKEK